MVTNFDIFRYIILGICYLCMIGIFLALIIKYYSSFSEYEYIWFCSKILTVKKMISKNNHNILVFSDFNNDGNKLYFKDLYYMNFLERTSKDGCLDKYKKCGILDTYGNDFCLTKPTDCPINKIIFDSTYKLSEYQEQNYNYYKVKDNPDLYFYFKKGVLNSGIVASWLNQISQPKYINKDNFIFDMGAFEECFGSTKDNDDDDEDDDDDDDDDKEDDGSEVGKEILEGAIDFAGDLIKSAAKAARINKLINYIDEKINDDTNNIDYNFTKIDSYNYVKSFMGFENAEAANKFKKIDFSIYKRRYPSFAAVVFSFIFIIAFSFFIILFIILLVKDSEPSKCLLVFSVILYCGTFLGFFIYSIVIYERDFKNPTLEIAKSIRADKFIEDFLKDFYTPFEQTALIISVIIILVISALLFILFWIIEPISKWIENIRSSNSYEKRITFSNQMNIHENQENERIQQNMQNNNNINRNELNTDVYQIDSKRVFNENRRPTDPNFNPNENDIAVNADLENNLNANNEKINEQNKDNNNLENQQTDNNNIN